jgi:thioredoxin reductase (NADPH)
MDKRKVIIIGSGPAGLTAALYTGRANLSPLVFGGVSWGGQLMTTTVIENFPGFPDGIEGPKLMLDMKKQAEKYGAEIIYKDVTRVDFSGDVKKLFVGEDEYEADIVIIATGATPKRLNVPGEDELYGRGVSTCATCDGALYRDKVVTVVGGGDTAMEEAMYLTNHASKVYIIHRRDEFRASEIMATRVMENEKIEILWNTEVEEIVAGDNQIIDHVNIINNKTNEKSELKTDGFFLAVGHIPVTGFLKGEVNLLENGYIDSPDGVHTSASGVFVAGDAQDHVYRQAVTAAGMGSRAAIEASRALDIA